MSVAIRGEAQDRTSPRPIAPGVHAPTTPTNWLVGPVHDVAMAFIWVPFAIAAHLAVTDPDRLPSLVAATLLFSFAHQPLTLWLAYGDGAHRRARSRLFLWAPVAAVGVAWLGPMVQPHAVAIVAGAWNAWHTLRQRYGIAKLYGRLVDIDCGGDNRLLWSWLSVAVLIAATSEGSTELARTMGLGSRNEVAVDTLASAGGVSGLILPIAGLVAVMLSAAWLRAELRRETHSAGRIVYLISTGALLITLAAAPAVGFIAYVGAHAAEYFFMVRWRVVRAARRDNASDAVATVGRSIGGAGTLVVYAAAILIVLLVIDALDETTSTTIILALGALHLLYDGVLWRSPKPAEGQ